MAQDNDRATTAGVEPPLGVVQASVDDKGRLKLPERFQSYLEACGVTRLFITTLDLRQARLYPMELWLANQNLLQSAKENAAAAERMAFLAKTHGGESGVDANGRLLLPAPLREALELEQKQPVWLDVYKGRINLMTRRVYEERMAASKTHMAGDLAVLEEMGLA